MKEKILKAYEFDGFGNNSSSQLAVKTEDGDVSIVLIEGNNEMTLISSCRDQWGCYYFLNADEGKISMAQEDGTRSFLQSLIKSLKTMREYCEFTKKPTKVEEVIKL